MSIEKKVFFGQLNSDSSDYALPKDHYLNAVNVDILTPEGNDSGDVTPIIGNTQVSGVPRWVEWGQYKAIGSCEDAGGGRIIYLLVSSDFLQPDVIMAYSASEDTNYLVLTLNDFLDGEISYTQTDIVSSMVVKGDFLMWASEGHPPYYINIDRAIKKYQPSYVTDADPYDTFESPKNLELAKIAPELPPYLTSQWYYDNFIDDWEYIEQFWIYGGAVNLLGDNSYLFATRYVYNDGEISVMSPYSQVAQPKGASNAGGIKVYYSSEGVIPFDVKYVELIVKYGNNGEAFVIDRIDAAAYSTAYFDFYNKDRGAALSDDYVSKDFESVPLESRSVESVGNKLVLGYNTDDYDTPASTTLAVTPYYAGEDYTGDWFSSISYDPDTDNMRVMEIRKHWGSPQEFNLSWKDLWYRTNTTALVIYIDEGALPERLKGWYMIPSVRVGTGFEEDQSGGGSQYGYLNINADDWQLFRDNPNYSELIYLARSRSDIITSGTGNVGSSFASEDDHYKRVRMVTATNYGSLDMTSFSITNYPSFPSSHFRNGQIIHKSGATYKYGVVYFDESKRKSFSVTNEASITTPKPQYNMLAYRDSEAYKNGYVRYVDWDLSGETPPVWADSYQIVRSETNVKSFFQFNTDGIVYAFKEADDKFSRGVYEQYGFGGDIKQPVIYKKVGEWNLSHGSYHDFFSAIAIPLNSLNNRGIGYTMTEGDYIRVTRQDGKISFKSKVIEVTGGYAIVDIVDIGIIERLKNYLGAFPWSFNVVIYDKVNFDPNSPSFKTSATVELAPWRYFCEIVTPSTVEADNYYEVSQVYKIIDGSLSTTSGKIRGDVYIERDTFNFREVMNRGGNNFNWEVDNMRSNKSANINSDLGELAKKTSLKWSGNYIYGTLVNNLNSFNAFDEEILSGDIGSIQRLVFTSKVSDYGNVLLAIGENDTLSIYIDETILTDTEGNENVQQSTKFIGAIRELKGSYGTLHPESIAEHKGLVYWWDENNKSVIRYSNAGLYPISDYYYRSYFKNIDSSNIRMYGGYNPLTESYNLTVPEFSPESFIEYPSDWAGVDDCGGSQVHNWGETYSIFWHDYTCTKVDQREYVAEWGDGSCLLETRIFTDVTWDDYTCVKTSMEGYFSVLWDDYLCTLETAVVNAFWGDYTCVQEDFSGSFTAEWESKICVNVTV